MKIFNTLIETSPVKVFASLWLGTFAGIGYAFLIPILTNSFNNDTGFDVQELGPVTFLGFEVSNHKFAALFAISCIVILAGRTLSQLILARVAIDTTSKLRIKYYNAIVKSPLANLEMVGSSRLIASFTTDIKMIVQGAMLLPDLLISAVTVFGMMCFLLYLNSNIFYFIVMCIFFGVLTFIVPVSFAGRFLKKGRDKVDLLQEGIKGNIYGVKELKLCSAKRESYFADILLATEQDVRKINKTAITITRCASNYGDMLSFFVMGFIAYIFVNYHAISQGELLAAIMILLYLTGPVSIVVNSLPDIINANVSFVKVDKLFKDIPIEPISQQVKPLPEWTRMRFEHVEYQYPPKEGASADEQSFSIGPLTLELVKGEVTFLVGGNGSGKSTLAKLIASYYLPKAGRIMLDDHQLDNEWVSSFRDQSVTIFTDYYLFDRLLGSAIDADQSLIDTYLKRLHLDHKVKLNEGRFSTLSLSDGQRKRLALLISLLEDKQFYLFDEWAADQDPEFKELFYCDILPYLKSKGKAILVISHDDRYFSVADRILTMENGKCGVIDPSSNQHGYNHIETPSDDDLSELTTKNNKLKEPS